MIERIDAERAIEFDPPEPDWGPMGPPPGPPDPPCHQRLAVERSQPMCQGWRRDGLATLRHLRAAIESLTPEERVQVVPESARMIALTEERDRLRCALLMYISVYGSADHHKDDCPEPDTCLQCQADKQADFALRDSP